MWLLQPKKNRMKRIIDNDNSYHGIVPLTNFLLTKYLTRTFAGRDKWNIARYISSLLTSMFGVQRFQQSETPSNNCTDKMHQDSRLKT